MRPPGLGDELRAALNDRRDVPGLPVLQRADGPRGFTSAEARVIAQLGPHMAMNCARPYC